MSKTKKVLLIDDEQPILDLFSRALEQRGHTSDTAENGRIGFRKAINEDWDLLSVIYTCLNGTGWNQ